MRGAALEFELGSVVVAQALSCPEAGGSSPTRIKPCPLNLAGEFLTTAKS